MKIFERSLYFPTYLPFLSLLPALLLGLIFLKQNLQLQEMEERIQRVILLKSQRDFWENRRLDMEERYSQCQADFLQERLGGLSLLAIQKQRLENFPRSPQILERLEFLTDRNHISIEEVLLGSFQTSRESLLRSVNPVEVDSGDLCQFLDLCEGNSPGKPQVFLSSFELNRRSFGNNETFVMNFQMIKREK